MKVAVTFEVTDEQRNIISRLKNPRATKRLATRHEVRLFLQRQLNEIRLSQGISQSAKSASDELNI